MFYGASNFCQDVSSWPNPPLVPCFMKTFHIQSSFTSDSYQGDWCLQAANLRLNANFNMRPCSTESKQKFFLDDLNQIRFKDSPNLCMEWKKKKLFVGECVDDRSVMDKTNRFVIDEMAGTIIVTKSKNNYLVGVVPKNKYQRVRLFKAGGKVNDSVYSWSLKLIGN